MAYFTDEVFDRIEYELTLIWKAHRRVGLEGKMCLYTQPEQDPWRAKNPNIRHWFGADEKEIETAVRELRFHFNEGHLPNSPLLLNPLVHQINETGRYEPIGSGIMWCTAFTLGVNRLQEDSIKRIRDLGVHVGIYERGENKSSGMKMLAFADRVLPAAADGLTVEGNEALYAIANIESPSYWKTYPLSDIEYLSKNGSFVHHNLCETLRVVEREDDSPLEQTLNPQMLIDAATCWKAYDRHHTLYEKFGIDPRNIDHNLKFFNLVARDISLFEATGTDRKSKDDTFDFLVEGWLPRGSVTVMGATGGTGKSSLAHRLAIITSIDWTADEHPKWLGMPLNKDFAKGLVIYFSGEDSAAIVNARAKMVDPDERSTRLMLQRNDFGLTPDGKRGNISHFLDKLKKLPEVSLVVIDPARKYLEGDEDDSEVVSNFFEAIEDFAVEKNCGMVVVHHLVKNAHPKDTRDIYDLLRGSQVFIDRPRAVLGMMREGPYTIVGLSKNNIPPNLGSVQGERLFVRDPDRLDLIMLPGKEGIRLWDVSADELREIRELAQQKASEE